MTYPDLIYKFFDEKGLILLLITAILLLILIIWIILKFFALPKIKEFFASLDKLVNRVEKNETEIHQVKIEVEVAKSDSINTKEIMERMADIHEKNMSELKLIVYDMQETNQEIAKAVYTIMGEHNANHQKKNLNHQPGGHKS